MRFSRSSYSKSACPLAVRNSPVPPFTANTTSSASIRPTPCASISAPSRSSTNVEVTLHSRRASALSPGELSSCPHCRSDLARSLWTHRTRDRRRRTGHRRKGPPYPGLPHTLTLVQRKTANFLRQGRLPQCQQPYKDNQRPDEECSVGHRFPLSLVAVLCTGKYDIKGDSASP
jgi:hypothetical protein